MAGITESPSDQLKAAPSSEESIGLDDFCDRFIASMIVRAGHESFANGCKVLDYAKETAPAYWKQASLRDLGPETCVVSDMRHWHEPWGWPQHVPPPLYAPRNQLRRRTRECWLWGRQPKVAPTPP